MLDLHSYVQSLISNYGQTITIVDPSDNKITSKAFIQPLRSDYQSPLYADYMETPGTEQYLYIGLAKVKLSSYPSGTTIIADSKSYKIKKIENVYLTSKIIYERAVLEEDTP